MEHFFILLYGVYLVCCANWCVDRRVGESGSGSCLDLVYLVFGVYDINEPIM